MKICFICPEYPPVPHGGMGTFVQVMGRALVRAGHEVRVIGIYPAGGDYAGYEEDEGVRVWRMRMPSIAYGWVLARYRLYRQVKSWVQWGEVELVDAHDPEGWYAGWPAMSVPLMIRAGGSFSYFSHELGQPISRSSFWFEGSAYRRADAWIAKSRYIGEVTQRLFGLQNSPDAVLYNPVNLPETAPPFDRRERNRVVFTGTLTPKKGIISLIDAWEAVQARCPGTQLEVYGKEGRAANGELMKGHLLGRLPEAIRQTVQFHGHVSRERLYEVLGRAGVAVFPSYAEGFAWAPLESMANGCPTIYSRMGSGPELILDGRDGILVDPSRPAEIAEALCRVLEDEGTARRLSEAGRERILEAFTLERLVPLNETFYRGLICRFELGGKKSAVVGREGKVAGMSGMRRVWERRGISDGQ